MTVVLIIITIVYLILIGGFVIGFDKVKLFSFKNTKPVIRFSVIIAFRDEAKNIPELLTSLKNLNYPRHLFEVLCIDDDSSDDSAALISTFANSNLDYNIRVLKNKRLTNSPKKDAITSAIKTAKNEWIITTDADCIVPKYWLDAFNAFIVKTNCQCVIAPVTYHKTNSLLKRFQLLDFLSLMGATIGGFGIKKPFLCNGANFGYSKTIFNTVNGFDGNSNIASGDDIFLLQKALKLNKKAVGYLKSNQAIVQTKPQPNWTLLIAQRKRWAAKTSHYNSLFGKLTGVSVLLMNAALICALTFTFIGELNLSTFIYVFIIKFSIDLLLLYKTCRFFNQERYLSSYLLSCFIYPVFSVYIAIISLFTSYKWKNRKFRK